MVLSGHAVVDLLFSAVRRHPELAVFLTLAIGFLVDDAIVFLENTVRRMERGEQALEASLNSAREISFTIFSMTTYPSLRSLSASCESGSARKSRS